MFNRLDRFASPFEPLMSLQRALDRAMQEDFFGVSTTSRGSYPPVGVFRDGEGYLLAAELPGVRREDIQIEVKDNLLRLSGERRPPVDLSEVSVHRRERDYGPFNRTVRLPEGVDGDAAQASFENGVLSVRLPLAAKHKARRISIT